MTVLEEILANGEVEPELLAELTDEQKIVLFYKIRQEQIKRWDANYKDTAEDEKSNYKVEFIKGGDGHEWVWVMGDAPGDESYDQIWMKYAIINAENDLKQHPENQFIPEDTNIIPSMEKQAKIKATEKIDEMKDINTINNNSKEPQDNEIHHETPGIHANVTEIEFPAQKELDQDSPDVTIESSTAPSEEHASSTVSSNPPDIIMKQSGSIQSFEEEFEAKFPPSEDDVKEAVATDSEGESLPFPTNEDQTPDIEKLSIKDRIKLFGGDNQSQPPARPPIITRNQPSTFPFNRQVPAVPQRVSTQNQSSTSNQLSRIAPPSFKPTYSPTATRPAYIDQANTMLHTQMVPQAAPGAPKGTSLAPQLIKTNPFVNPIQAQPRRSWNDSTDGAQINFDPNANKLLEKQTDVVRRYLRQSIIHDENEAQVLQADWEERERKAKQIEEEERMKNERFREIARRIIREQLPVPLSRAFCMSRGAANTVPQSRAEAVNWFHIHELDRRAGCEPNSGAICLWFHGIITREYTESLLAWAQVGSFLIRVSEKIFGYTLSYRGQQRCKHFLIDTSDGTYQFYGLNMKRHRSLYELVGYHATRPVSASGNELLLFAIAQPGQNLDYAELFQKSSNGNPWGQPPVNPVSTQF